MTCLAVLCALLATDIALTAWRDQRRRQASGLTYAKFQREWHRRHQ